MRTWLLLTLIAPLLAGCDFFTRNDGRLDLGITDAPVDEADAIVVSFTGVELRHEEGDTEVFPFDPPRTINLAALTGGDSELLLSDESIPSGRYERIRLKVLSSSTGLESYIDLVDGRRPLLVPADAVSGLDINQLFEVADGERSRYTIDVDLRRSVRRPEDGSQTYLLRPSLRLVEDDAAGRIAGVVSSARIVSGCVPAVYVFAGRDVTPDDVDGVGAEPLTSARVRLSTTDGSYRYQAAFLSAGGYTVAFTCDAGDDDPATSQTLDFVSKNVTVSADREATVSF